MMKRCVRCEEHMICLGDEPCWCFEYPHIITHAEDAECVCKTCLIEDLNKLGIEVNLGD